MTSFRVPIPQTKLPDGDKQVIDRRLLPNRLSIASGSSAMGHWRKINRHTGKRRNFDAQAEPT
jgi:hypothetical protein